MNSHDATKHEESWRYLFGNKWQRIGRKALTQRRTVLGKKMERSFLW